jgi:hypothetical protein
MRLSEIVVDRKRATLEILVSALTGEVIGLHDELSNLSENFSVPARQCLPRDSIHELITDVESYETRLTPIKNQVPQTMAAIAEVLNYLER